MDDSWTVSDLIVTLGTLLCIAVLVILASAIYHSRAKSDD